MKLKHIAFLSLVLFGLLSFTTMPPSSKYKCMIQMANYTGEGAYVVVSLMDPKGQYEKTLYVQGDDAEWYNTIEEWWKKFQGKNRSNLDAITGATVSGGGRNITVLDIEDSKINAGYKIRFETAVENQEYFVKDVEFELTTDTVKSKKEGTGFIRDVRIMPNN